MLTFKQITRVALHHGLIPQRLIPAVKIVHLVMDVVKIISKF